MKRKYKTFVLLCLPNHVHFYYESRQLYIDNIHFRLGHNVFLVLWPGSCLCLWLAQHLVVSMEEYLHRRGIYFTYVTEMCLPILYCLHFFNKKKLYIDVIFLFYFCELFSIIKNQNVISKLLSI